MHAVRALRVPAFKRAYKNLHTDRREAVNEAIRASMADPGVYAWDPIYRRSTRLHRPAPAVALPLPP